MEGNRFSGWAEASFFKFILEPRLDLQILEIPKEFMKTHGDVLSSVICLNIPTGAKWEFNLVRENDKAFLQNGWPEFVEFYSLCHGHCLMFKYEGDSRFDVIIFDMSASEIGYPLGPETCRKDEGMHTVMDDNKLKIASVNRPLNPKACMEILPRKRIIIDLSKHSSLEKAEGTRTIMDDDKLIPAKICSFTPEEDKRIHTYADKCKHPLFAIKMKPSFVEYNFSMKHLDKKRPFNHMFNLQIGTSKTWPVMIVADNTHVKLRKGWKSFVLDNKLKVDDVCIFELINKHEFKVHVFGVVNDKENAEADIDYPLGPQACRQSIAKERKAIDLTKHSSVKKAKWVQKVMDDKLILAQSCSLTPKQDKMVRAYAYQCKHPLFVTKMQPSFVEYHFRAGIPKEFEKKYLDKKRPFSRMFSLTTDTGKTWPVTMIGYNSQVKLKTGWKNFSLYNKLKVDDICVFELINKQKFKVRIFPVVNAKGNRRKSRNKN